MAPISREKIALLVFFVLIVFSLSTLMWYLSFGHSWNYAATNIDDATGTMDGYTVILFEGVGSDEKEKPKTHSSIETQNILLLESTSSDEEEALAQAQKKRETLIALGKKASLTSFSVSQILASHFPYQEFMRDESEEDSAQKSSGTKEADSSESTRYIAPLSGDFITSKFAVDIDEAVESYIQKNAIVFTLDTQQPEKYQEGLILKKANHRFGVIYVSEDMKRYEIRKQVNYFESHRVDFIVVLSNSTDVVAKVTGVDIVISIDDKTILSSGETIDGTFCVATPTEGSIGVIMISPSNVVSTKVITEL